jgi:hypothetical protein
LNARIKSFLIPFIVVDLLCMTGLVLWFLRPRFSHWSGKPDMQLVLRNPESKLTEIDIINNGNAAGLVTVSVDVYWPDADLVDAKGLAQYTEADTSRRSLRFSPTGPGAAPKLGPGETCAIGWLKLTDDVPVHGGIATDTSATTEP